MGMVYLGVAVLCAHTLPRWIGPIFMVVPVLGAAGLQGAISLLPDYLLFLSLFTIGTIQLRARQTPESSVAIA